MATQVQFRRGTTTQNNAFTGAIGEITYDTEIETLRLHDGSTPGGGAIVTTTTASQTLLNKVLSTGSTWEGGIIDLAYGGTGAALTAAAGGIVYSTSDAMGISSVGASGQVLTSGGTNAPTWVNASALTVGTSTTATSASNIEGGSSGYLVYQVSEDNTGFIAPGQSGYILRSTGASTAPNWVTSNLTIGTTPLQVGDTENTFDGLDQLNSTGTSHWTIPTGTTAQRPITPAAGMVRYNASISSFEGYGPGGAWGSLGGVKDVDQDTYITTETSAGSDEDTFTFYNAGIATATLTGVTFTSNVAVDFNSTLNVDGNTTLGGTLGVTGATTLSSTLAVTGTSTFTGDMTAGNIDSSTLDTTGNTTVGGTLGVTGATTLSSTLAVTGAQTNSSTLQVDGATNIDGALTATSTADITGNATVGGTLGVTGNTTVSGTLGVTGAATLSSDLIVQGNLTVSGATTTVNTETINLADNIITLNSNETGTPTQNGGFEIERGTSANVSIRWNETTDVWEFTKDGTAFSPIADSADVRGYLSASDGITYNSSTGAFTITDTGVTAGSYGSASLVPVITVNANGQITSASTVSVAGVTDFDYNTLTGVLDIDTADGQNFATTVTLGPFDTGDLVEGSNLYYLDSRARAAVSVTDAGGDGSVSYNNLTGVITYTGPSAAETRAHISSNDTGGFGALSYSSSTGVISYTGISTEEIQDVVGAMVSSNSESGISVTYQDADGTLDFNVNDPTITLAGDVSGSATMTNLGNVSITATVANDSHTHDGRYYTETESDARFAPIGASANTGTTNTFTEQQTFQKGFINENPFNYVGMHVDSNATLTALSGYQIKSGSSIIIIDSGVTLTIASGAEIAIG